jgi:DNA-directed RNA polymerase III subunit RPC1
MKNPVEDVPVRKMYVFPFLCLLFTLSYRKHIQFGALSAEEIKKSGSLRIWQSDLYDVVERKPAKGGVLDQNLGVSGKEAECETCGKKLADCIGHFGHINLALPVFHAGYFKATLQILQQICKVSISPAVLIKL